MNKSLGKELIDAVDEALQAPNHGKILRSPINVRKIRKDLHLTQREFSNRYHINLDTLRNWEQNKRAPDLTSVAFLTCIKKDPSMIDHLLNH
jgi:putative transcriptional regulator